VSFLVSPYRFAAAAVGVVLQTAPTQALNTSTPAASHTATLSGLPAGPKVVLVFFHADLPSLASRDVSSVSSTDGTAALICANPAGNTTIKQGAFAVTGATSTSFNVTVTYNGSMDTGYLAYAVLTNTAQTTYSSRSGANPDTVAPGVNPIVITSITIPSGGIGFAWCGSIANSDITWSQASGSPGVVRRGDGQRLPLHKRGQHDVFRSDALGDAEARARFFLGGVEP
jgi:hypothetical protein